MKHYVGITTGPIVETLSMTSTPAGLWYASYMFSNLTKNLCSLLDKNENLMILSPAFQADEEIDGIGSYYDRIIFWIEEESIKTVHLCIQQSIAKVKEQISQDVVNALRLNDKKSNEAKEYIENYIQIQYVILSEEEVGKGNITDKLSSYLDAIELNQKISCGSVQDYLMRLFQGKDTGGNFYIKNSRLVKEILNNKNIHFQLMDENSKNIKNIAQIAANGQFELIDGRDIPKTNGLKKWKYYAIVQADGDNLGSVSKYITDINTNNLAALCKHYTKTSAKMIHAYGGVTIYAGGDDLLFLAPVQNLAGKTIFTLCHEIQTTYKETFKEINQTLKDNKIKIKNKPLQTTLSFGIAIQYWKYPLYEALEQAKSLLFDTAKKTKNCLAIKLQKGNSANMDLCYLFDSQIEYAFNDLVPLFSVLSLNEMEEKSDIFLQSILYHIKNFEEVFKIALEHKDNTLINHFFKNVVETDPKYQECIEKSQLLVYAIKENELIINAEQDTKQKPLDFKYDQIIAALKIAKFFSERDE